MYILIPTSAPIPQIADIIINNIGRSAFTILLFNTC